uniref:Uncharacterized protein n=1 Tax=Arundo donax TaxID=35708 RepID=A0A0A9GS86_ARUDO
MRRSCSSSSCLAILALKTRQQQRQIRYKTEDIQIGKPQRCKLLTCLAMHTSCCTGLSTVNVRWHKNLTLAWH